MSMYSSFEVIASGLSAARQRMNTIASNVANAETTRTPEGGPYRRRDVVQVANSMQSKFSTALDRMSLFKPSVQAVLEDTSEPRQVYQPGHPDASDDGYVAYPNINVVTSMTDMMSTARLYQANVTALEQLRQMEKDASQISIRF